MAHHLHVHIELVQQSFVEHQLEGIAAEVNGAAGVQQDAIGDRRNVIAILTVAVAEGIDEFAGFFELYQGVVDLLEAGWRCGSTGTVDVDTLDSIVTGSMFDGCQDIVQS